MITLLTGVPGSGKSLKAVGLIKDFLANPLKVNGQEFKRTVYTNIKGLLLDHVLIDTDNMLNWPEWVKAGDVLVFDEVQQAFRPRAMGQKVPEFIAELEVHRSKYSIDFVLITQHVMLLDQNVRRLVGQHIDIRRVSGMPASMLYEWDYAAVTANRKTANSIKPWRWNKGDFKLYHSADIHTKTKRGIPNFILVLGVILVGAAFFLSGRTQPMIDRLTGKSETPIKTTVTTVQGDPFGLGKKDDKTANTSSSPGNETQPAIAAIVYPLTDLAKIPKEFRPTGCIVKKNNCQCYDDDGAKIDVELKQCLMATTEIRLIKTSRAQTSYMPTPTSNEVKKEPVPQAQNDNSLGINFPIRPVQQRYDKQAIGQNFLPVPAHVNSGGVLAKGF